MNPTTFDRAFDYTVGNEGGYCNDPGDPGGPTNWGIIQAELAKWRQRPVSIADMKALTKEEAKQIYKAWYWDVCHLDECQHPGMAEAVFDIAVNRGVGTGIKYWQWCLARLGRSEVAMDGHVGPVTIAAANAVDPDRFIVAFESRVEQGYYNIVAANSRMKWALKGWINRAHRLLTLEGLG